mmetsp:Transcript_21878/g.37212  ORF Transcript_21878/g.37212 Transcript_21878/m.37212 type:complete len:179 (+) Transcript_21878:94-630(+)
MVRKKMCIYVFMILCLFVVFVVPVALGSKPFAKACLSNFFARIRLPTLLGAFNVLDENCIVTATLRKTKPNCSQVSWKYFHNTQKTPPWMALINRRVGSPRPNSPRIPSFSTTSFIASMYDSSSFLSRPAVCFMVLTARRLFEQQSDTQDAAQPKRAERAKESKRLSLESTSGTFRKL